MAAWLAQVSQTNPWRYASDQQNNLQDGALLAASRNDRHKSDEQGTTVPEESPVVAIVLPAEEQETSGADESLVLSDDHRLMLPHGPDDETQIEHNVQHHGKDGENDQWGVSGTVVNKSVT